MMLRTASGKCQASVVGENLPSGSFGTLRTICRNARRRSTSVLLTRLRAGGYSPRAFWKPVSG